MPDDTGGNIGHDIHQQKLLLAKPIFGEEFVYYGVDSNQEKQVAYSCPEYGRGGCATSVEDYLQLGNEV